MFFNFFIISCVILIVAVLVWIDKDRNRYKEVLEKFTEIDNKCKSLENQIRQNSTLVDTFTKSNNKQWNDIHAVQEHCAKLREQQFILNKNQKKIFARMIPLRIEMNPIPVKETKK